MSDLILARGLHLPIDSVTRTFGIVGQRGTGKTSTAVRLVEEVAQHAPFVVVDPTGAWYGLRSSGDGKRAGVDCVVLGGHNGDVPLEPSSDVARMVADLVTKDRYSLVLDLELMRKGQQITFVADFLEELYHASRAATFVVLDEAQRFAPQTVRYPTPDLSRALGAMEDLVKLGRRKGLGAAYISQRAASINNEVLEQTETLIVHRLTGPADRKAMAAWFNAQGAPEDEKEALAALPKLKRGEAYVMSPAFLEIFDRFAVLARRTFDSSREPDVDEEIEAPPGRADVDLAALEERMSAAIERAEKDDPKKLREEIVRQSKRADDAEKEAEHHEDVIEWMEKEVRALLPEDADPELEFEEALKLVAQQKAEPVQVLPDVFLERLRDLVTDLSGSAETMQEALAKVTSHKGSDDPFPERYAAPRPPVPARTPRPVESEAPAVHSNGRPSGGAASKILDSLAWFEAVGIAPATRVQVAMVAGYHPRTKGFTNAVSALHTGEQLHYPAPGLLALTQEGAAAANKPAARPTSEELQRMVFIQVGPTKAELLRHAIERYPDPISREELATLVGKHPRTKGFTNAISSLKTLGVLDYPAPGFVKAAALLFV